MIKKIILGVVIGLFSFNLCFAGTYEDYNNGYMRGRYDSKKSIEKNSGQMLSQFVIGFYMSNEWGLAGLGGQWLANSFFPGLLYPASKLKNRNGDYMDGYKTGYAEVQNQNSVNAGLFGSVTGLFISVGTRTN